MGKTPQKLDINMVARAAGVSASTVSRTINHPDLVKPATRRKVEKAIRRTGYIRNRAAQTMHGRRSATLGLVVPTVNYSIFAELVQSFNDAVTDLGFTLLLASHGYDLAAEYRVLRKLLEHRVDGIALIGLDHSPDTWRLLESQDVPVIAAWSFSAASPVSCIGSDNAEAGRLAATHLLSLGHRHIGFVFPPTDENDRARSRMEAATDAVRDAGHDIPAGRIARSLYSIAHARTVCGDLLLREPELSAVLCGNDIIAQGAISAALHQGLSIPEQLSVVGIGDFAGSADSYPALSTVRLPSHEIGALTGRSLVEMVADHDHRQVRRIRLDVELMQRMTTGPARLGMHRSGMTR